MGMRLHLDEQALDVEICARRPELIVRIGTLRHSLRDALISETQFELVMDGQAFRGWWYRHGAEFHVRVAGRTYRLQLADREARPGGAMLANELRASMPGVVVAVHRAAGETVAAGESVITIESMKLQATLVAPCAARVAAVHFAPQCVFERGALLVSLTPEEQV
jgi:acetyl/propionyl-CoA carboxylase alpha subunit